MESTFDYLRAHAVELGSRILETYPPLQGTRDPVAPRIATLLGYQRDQACATLVSFLVLPAEPSCADHILGVVELEERIKPLDGIGCH